MKNLLFHKFCTGLINIANTCYLSSAWVVLYTGLIHCGNMDTGHELLHLQLYSEILPIGGDLFTAMSIERIPKKLYSNIMQCK